MATTLDDARQLRKDYTKKGLPSFCIDALGLIWIQPPTICYNNAHTTNTHAPTVRRVRVQHRKEVLNHYGLPRALRAWCCSVAGIVFTHIPDKSTRVEHIFVRVIGETALLRNRRRVYSRYAYFMLTHCTRAIALRVRNEAL